jgi:hypothetical protein
VPLLIRTDDLASSHGIDLDGWRSRPPSRRVTELVGETLRQSF